MRNFFLHSLARVENRSARRVALRNCAYRSAFSPFPQKLKFSGTPMVTNFETSFGKDYLKISPYPKIFLTPDSTPPRSVETRSARRVTVRNHAYRSAFSPFPQKFKIFGDPVQKCYCTFLFYLNLHTFLYFLLVWVK